MSNISIGKDVQEAYESIVKGEGDISWAVFSYEGQTELKLQNAGSDNEIDEFSEEFSDGKLQYAFMKVLEPNSKLSKFVLVGWCGEGAPRKGVFQQHFSSVARQLTGYHVQITARSEEDLSESAIKKKVEDSSGAKYTSVTSAASMFGNSTNTRKPTTNSLVNQLKGQNSGSFSQGSFMSGGASRKPVQSEPRLPPTATKPKPLLNRDQKSYKQDSDWSTPKTNDRGLVNELKSQKTDSSVSSKSVETTSPSMEPVKSSYQPIGRPDIAALRAQAQGESESSSRGQQDKTSGYERPEVPEVKSLSERMGAFQNKSTVSENRPKIGQRNVSNPLAARFGGAVGHTKAVVPTPASRDSKAMGGLSKNFGAEDGKTPAQLWAERKARERGESIPEPVREAPVKATVYGDDSQDDRSGISAIRERFTNASISQKEEVEDEHVSLPPPPPMPQPSHDVEEEDEEVEVHPHMPPPPPMNTRPVAAAPVISPPQRALTPEPESETEEQQEEEQEYIPPPAPPAPVRQSAPEPEWEEPQREPTPEPVHITHAEPQAVSSLDYDDIPHAHDAPAAFGAKHDRQMATVIYDYEKGDDNEISLEEGEVITDIEQIDEGWWQGTNSHGQSGVFPANYVELVRGDEEIEQHSQHEQASAHTIATTAGHGVTAIAIYEYAAAEEGEISFAEGEKISAIDEVDEGWWQGTNASGETGLFPSNYVEKQ